MDGHLDWYGIGPVVFWRLGDMRPGDRYWVRDETRPRLGLRRRRRVGSCPYNNCPVQRIFAANDGQHLNLITCHGTFNRAASNYDSGWWSTAT